jgi:hypothetical protein
VACPNDELVDVEWKEKGAGLDIPFSIPFNCISLVGLSSIRIS